MAAHETLEAKVDRLFEEWNQSDSPGAAVAVTRDGGVIYKQGYGMANLEYDIPITPTSIFDIASVSKQFAAFAIVTLSHQGKLSIDDDIRTHLPDLPDFGNTITIRHLLHHTSGLRDWVQSLSIAGDLMDDIISFKHILKMARHQKAFNFEPGTEYLYSNTGYNLLAEIVERVTGDSFREWTDIHIFKPLGMIHSHFHDDYEMILKNRAYSYQAVESGGFKHAVNNTTALGSSSLYSTVEDLAKWILNLETASIGGRTVLAQMYQRGVLNNGKHISYAFGLNIDEYRGLKTVGHSGSWRGFRSHLIHFPDQKFGVVILCNLDTFNPLRLAEQVADIYLADALAPIETSESDKTEESAEDTKSEPLAPEQLVEFEGDYYTDELDTTYTIRVCGNQLVAQHRRHDDILLTYADDHFVGDVWFFPEAYFTRDDAGQVTGFKLNGGRVRNLYFEKKID
ncbi:beta-lactamase family protein [Candidatus Poribacteria bacterium]|nr:beta-lactamase family protein [Candidatus Poribacteria bacterium]